LKWASRKVIGEEMGGKRLQQLAIVLVKIVISSVLGMRLPIF
jgi:hypothetical protein